MLKLAAAPEPTNASFSALAESLKMSQSEVFSAAQRALKCHLLVEDLKLPPGAARLRPVTVALEEFLIGGLRYVFPAETGRTTRGLLTAMDAPPLAAMLHRSPDDLPLVWPHADGDARGLSLKPLYPSVPDAALADRRLREWLALADAIRAGDARVRRVAAELLHAMTRNVKNART